MVRITGGVFKGRRLAVPPGIRPTTELARKAAFDILGDAINGARVLDAAAGSGAYGLEALSRGAAHVTFVESDREVLESLRKNIFLALGERPEAPGKSAEDFLRKGRGEGRATTPAAHGRVGPRIPVAKSRTSVVGASVSAFVSLHLLRKVLFDLIFHDPPYEAASEADLSGLLSLLAPDGWLFHERGDDLQLTPGGRAPDDMRRYGTTRFLIFRGGSGASA